MSDTTLTQADIDKAVAEALEGVKAKNAELLDELKTVKAELRKSKEIDPADLTAAEERAEKAEKALAEATKQIKTLTTERDKAVKDLEGESGFTSKLLIDNGLNAALAEAGVKEPAMLKAVKAMLAGSAQVVADGTDRVVKIGDKVLADHIKEWAGTDEAKHFISAAGNGGGGAPGGKGGSGAKTMSRAEYNEKAIADPKGMQAFIKDGGQIIDVAA